MPPRPAEAVLEDRTALTDNIYVNVFEVNNKTKILK
jgi:hypothetical protein